jgi:hypothetical protein
MSFETWFIFYKMDCQSNTTPSEKDHDLPMILSRDFWSGSQHTQPLHHLGRPSNARQMSKESCQIPAGSSNLDDEFGLQTVYTPRFVKSSLCLDGLITKNVTQFKQISWVKS